LAEYCDFLRTAPGQTEIPHVVNELTTNYTQFLREEDHFKFLVTEALPLVCGRGQKPFCVWSAACATGEESYSIGFYLNEHYPLVQGWDWRVLSTDISTQALRTAQRGIYSADRLTVVPERWLRKYFQRGQNAWEGYYRVKPFLAERMIFKQINLLARYDFSETFPVIFCRNVMIYFDRPHQEQLVGQLSRFLEPKGFLVVGHAESLTGLAVPLHCCRPSIYQKQ
jgi:chemotaxis protein methyltransferase CheR